MASASDHWLVLKHLSKPPTVVQRMSRDLGWKPAEFTAETVMANLELWAPNTLAEILAVANTEYWGAGECTLSDTDYDLVVERLRTLVPDHPQLNALGNEPNGRCFKETTKRKKR